MDIFQTSGFWYFLIPVVIGILFWYDGKSTRDEKKHMLDLFKSNKNLSLRIQKELSELIEKHNCHNSIAFPERNLTYKVYLEMITEEHINRLSDDMYDNLKNSKLSKPSVATHINSLSTQNDNLILMEIDLKRISKTMENKGNFFVL